MNKQQFVEQLERLIAFQTVTGNIAENAAALKFVESLLNPKAVIKKAVNNTAEIFIAGTTDTLTPNFCYLVHMDVVAAKPEQFKAKVLGDKIYGRGASDMKFSVPLGVTLLNEFLASGSPASFALAITTDEETGGLAGGLFLAEEMNFRPKCLIVPDGGDNLVFVDRAKGVCQVEITALGAPAHASRPWMGKNAIEPIVLLGNELLKVYGKNSLKENWRTTMNMGQIRGGFSLNQVCPEASLWLDFRYPETDSVAKIVGTVEKLAKKVGAKVSIKLLSTGLPTFTNASLPVVQNFLQSMEKTYGKKIVVAPTYGASDARHFAKYDVPVLMMKPIGGEIHSANEWTSISSCLTFYQGLRDFLKLS